MPRPRSHYVASLDGLRTFAVLAVIAYHLGYAWAPGGLLGVTVFFVLSGYLITGLLVNEFRSSKTLDLPQFWLRRVRRLVPAIVTVVLVTCALCALFNHQLLTKTRPDILPSLLFYNNWWQIFHEVSYFEAQGAPSALQHFWSLAIEEQFYLVWPPLLLLLFNRRVKFKNIHRGILIAAAISAIAMAVLYNPESDPSRVYFGTDTRAFSLLIGAWLAFTWPSSALGITPSGASPAPTISTLAIRLLDGAGILAFAGLCALVFTMDGNAAFPYRGGILLCSILAAILIADIVHPASLFARLWALPPLVWLGKRSYGIYLWHFPILLLMTNQNATEAAPLWWNALEVALIIAVSAASYTFIEDPIRKGWVGKELHRLREDSVHLPRYLATHTIPALICVAVAGTALIGCAIIPDENPFAQTEGVKTAEEAQAQSQQNANAAAEAQKTYDVLMIGDSVSARCENIFTDFFPNSCLDAAVGRPMTQAQEVYDRYLNKNAVGKNVVIALGTNDSVTNDQIESLIAHIGSDKHIVLVTTQSDKTWLASTNEALTQAASSNDNVVLVDWYTYSLGNDSLFSGDGTHLTKEAAEEYLTLIAEAIETT